MPRKRKTDKSPRLYHELAEWFHLLTAPEDYKEEAEFYRRTIVENSIVPVKTVLEMGSGGGNNASHMKAHFNLMLTDLSENMLAISRRINPECEHIRGDMRNMQLERQFDAVFVQDAISHLLTINDLSSAIETAFVHCKPGGVALLAPDYTRESFKPSTQHGGHDGENRGMRYLEWTWDPDPADTEYIMDFAYLMREKDKVRCEYDRMAMGLFSKNEWLLLMKNAGFTDVKMKNAGFTDVKKIPYPDNISWTTPVFIGVRSE